MGYHLVEAEDEEVVVEVVVDFSFMEVFDAAFQDVGDYGHEHAGEDEDAEHGGYEDAGEEVFVFVGLTGIDEEEGDVLQPGLSLPAVMADEDEDEVAEEGGGGKPYQLAYPGAGEGTVEREFESGADGFEHGHGVKG